MKREHIFILVILLYFILSFFDRNLSLFVFKNAIINLLKVLPFIALAQVIIFILDRFFGRKKISSFSGVKAWVFYSFFGVISMGPIYMWYEIFKELREKGLKLKYIALFLYNRAIKLQLIPLMAVLLGIKIALLLNLLIFVFSFAYAFLVGLFVKD